MGGPTGSMDSIISPCQARLLCHTLPNEHEQKNDDKDNENDDEDNDDDYYDYYYDYDYIPADDR